MRGASERLLLGVAVLAGAGVIALAAIQSGESGSAGSDPKPPAPAFPVSETVAVSSRPTARVRDGFLGFSIEFQALRRYTGPDPARINPVFEALVRGLSGSSAPQIRIGGDSSDVTWLPTPGLRKPRGVSFSLDRAWLRTIHTLAADTGARVTFGLNLAGNEPRLAAAEARAAGRALGPASLAALEIGNEPNVYNVVPWFHDAAGRPIPARAPSYGFPAFAREFRRTERALPRAPLAGPAYGIGPSSNRGPWITNLPGFISAYPRLRVVTIHRYPLRNCSVVPSSPQYPTIRHLLTSYASRGLAHGIARDVSTVHRAGRLFRLDELNSVACRGKRGVSDTYAASLWALDTLFSLSRVGVDGVNFHTLPGAAYQLFSFRRAGGGWRVFVRPVYYGALMFEMAAPGGSRLLASRSSHAGRVSAWADRTSDGGVNVVLINKTSSVPRTVGVVPPAGAKGPARLVWMRGPNLHARSDVTIGGRTFGTASSSGKLAPVEPATLGESRGKYRLRLPPASAVLVQFSAPSRSQQ